MPTVARGLFKWICRRSATLEDLADRLNHFWTFGLLLLFAAIISWRQSYLSPLHCWMPAQFTDAMNVHTEEVCWNSYFILDLEEELKLRKAYEKLNISFSDAESIRPLGHSKFPFVHQKQPNDGTHVAKRIATKRTLYQWLPLILCFQALLFKLPNLIMYVLHGYSGINFDKLAALTNGYENLTLQDRSVLCRRIGRYLYTWCQKCEGCLPWRHLTFLWFLTKLLYCVNIITQLSLVDGMLAPEETRNFGEVILSNLYKESAYAWKGASAFPKDVFCDLDIHHVNNLLRYSFQCSISANYFSEFVYMFIWVWLYFVAVVTCARLFIWLYTTLIPMFRIRYITKALQMMDDNDFVMMSILDTKIEKFCQLLGEDGVMALKLIGASTSEIVVGDVVQSMWNVWSTHQSLQPAQVSIDPSFDAGDIPLVEQ